MKKDKGWTKWLYWFTFAVAVVFVYKMLDNFTDITNWVKGLLDLLMPFIIGILIAYLFYLPSKKLETIYRKAKIKLIVKKSRVLAVMSVYIIALLLIILLINFVLPAISRSVMDLVNNLPNYYNSVTEFIKNNPDNQLLNKINVQEIMKHLQEVDLSQYFSLQSITQYAKGVVGLASGIFKIFVTIVVSIYILLERSQIMNFLKKLASSVFKKKTYRNIGFYFEKTNEIFFRFISSQILDGIVVGVLTSIAMSLLGVKYAILLGFMIGLFNIIPYFGAIIAVSIAILITILTGGIGQAIWMAIVVIVLQQIDANIINPKIIGSSLSLSPILVIFAVTIGGAYFSVLGMFLAVPVIAVIKILVLDYIEYKNQKQIET